MWGRESEGGKEGGGGGFKINNCKNKKKDQQSRSEKKRKLTNGLKQMDCHTSTSNSKIKQISIHSDPARKPNSCSWSAHYRSSGNYFLMGGGGSRGGMCVVVEPQG